MTDVFDSALQFALFSFLCATALVDVRPKLQILLAVLLLILEWVNLFSPIRFFVPATIGDPANADLRVGTVVVIMINFVVLFRKRLAT